MSLYNKLQKTGSKLYSKAVNTPNLFRKVNNSILKGASFVKNVADAYGLSPVSQIATNVARGSNVIKNSLEKSIRAPVNELRAEMI